MFENLLLYCDGNDVKEATALDGIIKKIRSRELSETGTFGNGNFLKRLLYLFRPGKIGNFIPYSSVALKLAYFCLRSRNIFVDYLSTEPVEVLSVSL